MFQGVNVKLVKQCNKSFFKVSYGRSIPLSLRSTRNGSSMKSFGVTWFIILLDKSTVIKDGLIGSPLNETNSLFEFTVSIFRFFAFENLSKLCSAPWLFSGTKTNSFRVGVFWFRTSWWVLFYMFQLVPKCIKTIMSSGNYEKEGDCFGRLREKKLIWLACIQLLYYHFYAT